MKTFQITQNFGKGSKGYVYFNICDNYSIDIIKKEAIRVQIKNFEDRLSGLIVKAKEKKSIVIKEYCNKKNKVIKEGLNFSVKWC